MASLKVTELTDISTNLTDDDLVMAVQDPAGTPASRKATILRVRQQVGGLLYALSPAVGGADKTTTSTSLVDVDATNAVFPFTAPPSGKVLLSFSACVADSAGFISLGVHDGSADVANSLQIITNATQRVTYRYLATGLTPGTSYTFKMRFKASAGTASVYTVGSGGGWTIEVWSVPQ